jgi:hypothetical protein
MHLPFFLQTGMHAWAFDSGHTGHMTAVCMISSKQSDDIGSYASHRVCLWWRHETKAAVQSLADAGHRLQHWSRVLLKAALCQQLCDLHQRYGLQGYLPG